MKIETNLETILEMMDRPAFCVSDGVVRAANAAARNRMVTVGTEIAPLLHTGREDYAGFDSGHLFLTMCIGGTQYDACVTLLDQHHLFTLDHTQMDAQLRAFALAAQELRMPLNQAMITSEQLFPKLEGLADPQATEQIARMNRSLYQMLRVVGNMSDSVSAGTSRMEIRDVAAVVQEIIDHSEILCEGAGLKLRFINHPAPIYSLIDEQKLERALYNLLSNAMKHTPSGGEITIRLSLRKRTILLSVSNPGAGSASPISPGMFRQFSREPGIADTGIGLGLGLTLIRSVAAAHGGALLFDQSDSSGGMRATLSFPIRQDTTTLRSPTMRIDYAGERDHGLIELSELLPPDWYLPSKM